MDNEMKHEDHKTEEEIKAFIDKTKAAMDSDPEVFNDGIDRICHFIAPLSAESFLRWIQLLVDAYNTDNGDRLHVSGRPTEANERSIKESRERLQKINVALNKRPVFTEAISRFHEWKNRLPTQENAWASARRFIDRINTCPSISELEKIIRDGRTQREKWESVAECGEAFRAGIMMAKDPIIEHKLDYLNLFKKHVFKEEGLSSVNMTGQLTDELREMGVKSE